MGDEHRLLLPDAVEKLNSLLALHRVPRQVVVDEDVCELQVAALAARLSGDEDLAVRAELPDSLLLLLGLEATVKARHRVVRTDLAPQVLLREIGRAHV